MVAKTALFARKQPGGILTIANETIFPGKILFVQNSLGTDAAGYGENPNTPYASIHYAAAQCTANAHDTIFALPGHVDTITAAAALVIDVAGVSIIGIGRGAARPLINFTTSTAADMDIDAASCYIENFIFQGSVDALVAPIDVNAADFTLKNCETRDVIGTAQALAFITTDDAADRMTIDGWKHRGDRGAGAATALTIVGGDDIVVKDFDIVGNFSTAAIRQLTTISNNLRIYGDGQSFIRTFNAADTAITVKSDTTGSIGPNLNIMLADNAANITESCVGAAMTFFQPINVANLAGESSMQINITASVDE